MSVELINKYVEPVISCFTFDNEQNQQCDLSGLVLPIIATVAVALTTSYCLKKQKEMQKIQEQKELEKQNALNAKLYKASGTMDMYGYEEKLKKLVQDGAQLEMRFDEGHTPLHYAAFSANSTGVEILFKLGADPEAKDENGNTPLQTGAKQGFSYVVESLIKKCGANKGILDLHGNNLLHLAAKDCSISRVEWKLACLKKLIECGINKRLENELGQTPLQVAKKATWSKDCLGEVKDILGFDFNLSID